MTKSQDQLKNTAIISILLFISTTAICNNVNADAVLKKKIPQVDQRVLKAPIENNNTQAAQPSASDASSNIEIKASNTTSRDLRMDMVSIESRLDMLEAKNKKLEADLSALNAAYKVHGHRVPGETYMYYTTKKFVGDSRSYLVPIVPDEGGKQNYYEADPPLQNNK